MALESIDELQRRLKDLETFYAQRNTNMLSWRELYFMRPEQIWKDANGQFIEPEPDEERLVLPIPQNVVEGYRELLLAKSPSISVPTSTSKGVDLVHAEHNERALLAIWDRAGIYERLRDATWHGLVDGWGVLQIAWDKNAEEGESPIVVTSQDPYNVYALPGSRPGEWKYVIHAYPRLVGQVRDEWYPDSSADGRTKEVRQRKAAFDGLKDTDEVTFIDYWDEKVNAIALSYKTQGDGIGKTTIDEVRWLKPPTPHGYGFLPWQIFMPNRLPFNMPGERMGVSILYVMEELIGFMDRMVSAKATMLSRWQDPPLVTETELGPDFEPVRMERGMHLRLRPGEKANYLVHPGPMPQIDTMIAQASEYIETSGLPRVLQGLYVGAVSGIAMSLLRNPTLMKIAFRQKEIETALEELNRKILMLLEKKLRKPLYLWGRGVSGQGFDIQITAEQIKGYYRNKAELSASLPTDDANTVNMLGTLVQLNIISRRTARDVAQRSLHDLVSPSLIDEEELIIAEGIMNDPGMMQALAAAAAQGIQLHYLPKQENPRGGYGEEEVAMPGGTLATRTPMMPGGNTQPGMQQRLAEMAENISPTGEINRLIEEKVE